MTKPTDLLRSICAGREIVNAHEVLTGLADCISGATFLNDNDRQQRVRDVSDVKAWLRQLAIAAKE